MASAASIYGRVLVGGGTGFVGSNIVKALRKLEVPVTVVTRNPHLLEDAVSWKQIQSDGLPQCRAVINVSGESFLDVRKFWTDSIKLAIRHSRVNTTKILRDAIINAKDKPDVFLTISGVGYYKPSTTEEYNEHSQGGDFDYFSRLCTEWESAAELPKELGVRNVIIRSGVVLGRDGGIIKQLYIPFFLGLGGTLGLSGTQYMPWIHIDDLVGLFMFGIEERHVDGVLNGVAPQVITNKEFVKALGAAMWRPTVFPVPEFVVKFLFGPERAIILLEGQKVIPERVLKLGFEYLFPDIKSACKSVI